jgi:hypothetical protein
MRIRRKQLTEKGLLKSTLILAALAGMSGPPAAHAQSISMSLGLRMANLIYVTAPDGEHLWAAYGDPPHCQRWGMGRIYEHVPQFHAHFVLETAPISLTNYSFYAEAAMHRHRRSSGSDSATFSMPPPPQC